MTIYDILKEKANSIQYKNELLYYDLEVNRAYSFYDVYNLVNKYINMFSELDIKGKKKYLIVDNSVDSIVIFIALLKCGAIPILINKSELEYDGKNHKEHQEEIDKKYVYELELDELKYDYIVANDYSTFISQNEEISIIREYIDRIEQKNYGKGDFYICTSGVTGKMGKLIPLKDSELIKRSIPCNRDYSIITSIPISAISGIIYDVYRPIINNVKNYLYYISFRKKDDIRLFKDISYYRINRVLLPRDILDILSNDLKQLDLSCLDTIYLAGEINNDETIKEIRKYLTTLRDNVIVSMYGRTESYGNICLCHENNIKSLYINVLKSNMNELVYTFDKKHIYKMYYQDGKKIVAPVDISYDDNYYANFLSVSEKVLDNISIDGNNVIGEIIVDNEYTGDLGVYLDNQLYVVGRKKDLVLIDGKEYFLPMYEQMFSNITGLKTAAILNEKTNKIFTVVNYKVDPQRIDNFKNIIPLSKKCNEIIDKYNLSVEYPLFVASDSFPKTKLMRKTKKGEIKYLIDKNMTFQYRINNYTDSFVNLVSDMIEKKCQKKITVLYENNEFIFKKSEITFYELYELENNIIGYTHFREDQENYYFVIDDAILLNIYPDFNFYSNLWYENKIKYVQNKYFELSSSEFTEFFNKLKDRNIRYVCIKLFGVIEEEEEYYTFRPYQLAANTNYHTDADKLRGMDLPFIKANKESIMMVYLDTADSIYYSDEELNKKIEEYSSLLNHVYQVKKDNREFYIDQKIADKDNKIYKEMIDDSLFMSYNYRFRHGHIFKKEQLGVDLGKDNLIVINDPNDVQSIINCFSNYDIMDLYSHFKIYGLSFRIDLNYQEQINFLIDNVIMSSCYESLDDLGIIVYTNYSEQLRLSNKEDMELFNLVRKQSIKIMYDLVNEIRKKGKKEVVIDGKKIEIDLSNLKIVIVTLEKHISEITYIFDIIKDCKLIDARRNDKKYCKKRR